MLVKSAMWLRDMTPKPSVERTASGVVCTPPAAAHLQHWASPAEGGRGNGDAALGILVVHKEVRL